MTLTQKIQNAINTSARLHKAHIRIGLDLPYIVHPYSVACLLSQYTDSEDVICAGFLHDVLEDAVGYTYENLKEDFGESVAVIVKGVTEIRFSDADGAVKTWHERKSDYLKMLVAAPPESLLVCAADTTHNLQSLLATYRLVGDSAWGNFHASIEEKVQFYRNVIDILAPRLQSGILNDVEEAYRTLVNVLGENTSREVDVVS